MTNYDFFWSIIAGLLVAFIGFLIKVGFEKYRSRQNFKSPNPFNNLPQIRENKIRRIVGQIMTGQSSAIIGVFERERTKILDALDDQEYGNKANRLIFSKLDISSLDANCDPEQFWKQALQSLKIKIDIEKQRHFLLRWLRWLLRWNISPQVVETYKKCQDNSFDNFYLKELFKQLKENKRHLVLMIDRSDLLLQRKHLKRSDFFGNLREMADGYLSSLNLVITLSMSLKQFHQQNEELNPGGSPYFNFIDANQVTLGVLSETEIDQWLQKSERNLIDEARGFIKNAAGGHPYLLRVATYSWWNAYDEDENNLIEKAEQNFHQDVRNLANEVLKSWSKKTCQAFLSILQKHNVSDFIEELYELEEQGFIIKEDNVWQICPSIFSSLLAEKAMSNLRDNRV